MVTFVVPHDPEWTTAFSVEAGSIHAALGDVDVSLHHIGSTAIPGILAKPIIDLLGAASDLAAIDAQTTALDRLGYEAMGSNGIAGRLYFRKFDDTGRRTHHFHVFEHGSPHIERHLAFRDYLIAHREIAATYSDLKARLTSGEGASWDAYLDGKDSFIRAVEPDAIAWYRQAGNR